MRLAEPLNDSVGAWQPSKSYLQGDVVVYAGVPYVSISDHTSVAGFESGMWRATSFIQGTGKAGSPANNGNADIVISSDSAHPTPAGEDMIERYLANALRKEIRELAGAADLI